ncbi:VIT1/CCC1 transporter family protein [Sediminivirga luteola]|uniref:Rubrerythrin family protein n=1 Tax=Sediminivirga luteola TaxID=1774748 RepID=A0A8J2U0K9_9MICO|nr:VIT1/CCC1 transporter family protein [Sediminivirga luteola]MCI2265021.1 VIT1/CCC1 transporter family protein [Sediminivirga luteola]GGA25404.1 hypothetical protein GCM10011333_30510 [Sediminivirga luteola]
MPSEHLPADPAQVSAADRRRWRRYLAAERREEYVYRSLARRREGEEREILLGLAEAEKRHQQHWVTLLRAAGEPERALPRPGIGARILVLLGRVFGSVLVLALAQTAESRSPYETDRDASAAMAADERIHGEVVRALAQRGRNRISGSFRAAIFGMNDGLVSNLALILGVGAAGLATGEVLITGLAGLLAGALSMAAGEFISVRSQRELLEASTPDPAAQQALPALDVDANELALVYRARGETPGEAEEHARRTLARVAAPDASHERAPSPHAHGAYEEIGTGLGAAGSSFLFFASGALIPVLPYLFGLEGAAAVIVALVAVGVALTVTGAVVGILSGTPPLLRALRQLGIGYGAALVTYLLGLLFGVNLA